MPIIISLKEPAVNLILEGDIKDESGEQYDQLFPNLMVKDQDGHNMVIPLSRDCNIAFIKETTQAEIDEQKTQAEKRRQEMRDMGGGGPTITRPQFVFPTGRKGRG